jgi:hypothetical protein
MELMDHSIKALSPIPGRKDGFRIQLEFKNE